MNEGSTTGKEPESSSSGEALLESLLTELLEVPTPERQEALESLCVREPAQAEVLRRRLALLESALPAAPEPTPMRAFGPFRRVRLLGVGMTETYLAIDTRTDTQVVLKLLRHAALLDATTAGSFAREALAAARLHHPCIGGTLECGTHDGTHYLVQPFVAGITLADWIRQRRQRGGGLAMADVELVLAWLEDILQALHCAHEAGFVHRDVKPSNILLPFQGRPRLLDFGLCRELGPRDPEGTPTPAAGTLAYMPPEALAPRALPPSRATDVYAAGVTLFEALALQLPFAEHDPHAHTRAVLLQDPPDLRRLLPGASRGLRRVLAVALAKSPEERYASALAFADDLRNLRHGRPVMARRAPLWRRLCRAARRHRQGALFVVASVLLAATFALPPQLARAGDGDSELHWVALGERVRRASALAAELVPGTPDQVPALTDWLATYGEPLAAELPRLRARVAAWSAQAANTVAIATMRIGLQALEGFVDEPRGTLAAMRRRLQWARTSRQLTLEAPAASWQQTIAAIAAEPRYHGLRLSPQLDLVPLGPDPDSGLFEFHHTRSEAPDAPPVTRDAATGQLRRADRMGLVFVLVPGGEPMIGEQPYHEKQVRYDPAASIYARPHPVPLAPFFLSKYEMTRSQWQQLAGWLPDGLRHGESQGGDPPIGHAHPVASLMALECDELLRAVGLVLPTEAQWEYASGTGAPTLWFFGNDAKDLVRFGNVDDRRHAAWNRAAQGSHDFDDGYASLAPIGCYAANAFGLHDVVGNVAEWCLGDVVDYHTSEPRPGDGLRLPGRPDGLRAFRGSTCWYSQHKTSSRPGGQPTVRQPAIGLRPARAIDEGGR